MGRALGLLSVGLLFAACWVSSGVVVRVQSGPLWEVPVADMNAMVLGARLALVLLLVSMSCVGSLARGFRTPWGFWVLYLLLFAVAAGISFVVIRLQPEQWVVQHPAWSQRSLHWLLPTRLAAGTLTLLASLSCVWIRPKPDSPPA